MEGYPYLVHLKFYLGSLKSTNSFPIGERVFFDKARLGEKINLPHEKSRFYNDMPQAYVDALIPNTVIGLSPILQAGIFLPRCEEDPRL